MKYFMQQTPQTGCLVLLFILQVTNVLTNLSDLQSVNKQVLRHLMKELYFLIEILSHVISKGDVSLQWVIDQSYTRAYSVRPRLPKSPEPELQHSYCSFSVKSENSPDSLSYLVNAVTPCVTDVLLWAVLTPPVSSKGVRLEHIHGKDSLQNPVSS